MADLPSAKIVVILDERGTLERVVINVAGRGVAELQVEEIAFQAGRQSLAHVGLTVPMQYVQIVQVS